MKKYLFILFLIIFIFGLIFWRVEKSAAPASTNSTDSQIQSLPITSDSSTSESITTPPAQESNMWLTPLDRAKERVTKKYFGIFITPATSPVQPERFRGYHTGTDFEIFPEELNSQIDVRAVCEGKLIIKKTASGYGGVAVESCKLDGQPVMVIYGHLKLSSIAKNTGNDLKAGDTIGQLGAAHSTETDGERKHLHLGIRKGTSANLLGYVQTKNELKNWVDPCFYICK
jgi:murein DD-endopeptidase MepM/ murein hydrolase activator NlpD